MYGDGAHSEGLCILVVVSEPLFGPLISGVLGRKRLDTASHVLKKMANLSMQDFPSYLNAWINSSCSASEAMLIFALYKTQGVGVGGINACQMKQGMIVRWKYSA